VTTTTVALPDASGPPLWRRQALALVKLELAKGLSWARSFWLFFLAFAPTAILLGHALFDDDLHRPGEQEFNEHIMILAVIMQVFYARVGLFFGCLGIAVLALRGEVAEKTLHYPLLAPMRREVLIAGKFLAGALLAVVIFGAGVLASYVIMFGHFDAGREFMLSAKGLAQLRDYLLLVVMGCVGYSAVFLAMSLVFRNPVITPLLLFLWEGANGILPAWLKRFSVTYYLKPLFPVELPVEGISGLFTVVAEPTPVWLAVWGMLAFAVLVLAYACWKIRRYEISYSTD
jgi:ABC-type transport system involved in multi-copper enzyme maturation permease subunit